MEGVVDSPTIRPISKGAIHRICSGQVILDLSSAVKELVENSLDAGASSIEISLKDHGEESFKVTDNGCGISPNNFQVLALKHHTSKIADFPDLQSLTTFGFRGEALSSLCALGNLTIETRTKNEPVGTHLTFDHSGLVTSERKTARQIGTTVTVEKLFSPLPVRNKEFSRNIRREYGKLISLLNAYALVAKGVRLVCTNTTGKNAKSVVLKTPGSSSFKDNIITVFGMNTFACLEPLNLCISDGCKVEGFLSKPGYGSGRNLGDRQFYYVNGRPVDMPKVSKLINELYKSANSRQYPVAIMNFAVPTKAYDVNVTPDKRKIFFSDEGSLIISLREAIEKIYSPSHCSYSINRFEEPMKEPMSIELDAPRDKEDSKRISPTNTKQKEAVCSHEQIDDIPINMVKKGFQDSCINGGIVHCNEENPISKAENTLSSYGTEKSESLFSYQPRQLRTPSMSNSRIYKHAKTHERAVEKNIVENVDSSFCSNFIQSSLTKFVTVNKRKHENSCTVLSELPVLRSEMIPCQVRKTNSNTHRTVSRSFSTHHPVDDSTEVNKDELLEHCGALNDSNEVEIPVSSACNLYYGDAEKEDILNQDEVLPCADVASKDPTAPLLQSSNVTVDTPVPCSGLEICSTAPLLQSSNVTVDTPVHCSGLEICSILQFSMNDLRTRRLEKLSRSYSNSSPPERLNIKRCYAAATLENSQLENEGKTKILAAATSELERFFRKEDFGRMKVIGQFNLGFIIGKVDQDLFIVDQHAADEKYNFERLSQSTILNQQPLLQPMRLELSPAEEVTASAHMEVIRKNGFTLVEDVHAPPGLHFLLKAVPFSKNITFGAEDVKELISTLADSQGECSIIGSYKTNDPNSICPSRVWGMLASRACRSSVMIGDSLGKNEMQKILHHLSGLMSPWNCPHGRPTMRHLVDLSQVRAVRDNKEGFMHFYQVEKEPSFSFKKKKKSSQLLQFWCHSKKKKLLLCWYFK
ncbi:DNA mismatch repair protein isoform X2 [Tasmannia lanceolata]|uniref:DNA mismatch repair protein isoform X2 n=1 Tax=Tasmannia lanceolata TaxID=3420 RepID=UPI0040643D66